MPKNWLTEKKSYKTNTSKQILGQCGTLHPFTGMNSESNVSKLGLIHISSPKVSRYCFMVISLWLFLPSKLKKKNNTWAKWFRQMDEDITHHQIGDCWAECLSAGPSAGVISYPSRSCRSFEYCFVVIGLCPDFLKQSSGVVWVCLLSFMLLVIQRHSAVVPVLLFFSHAKCSRFLLWDSVIQSSVPNSSICQNWSRGVWTTD